MPKVCLTIVCPPAAEEQVWDFLVLAENTGVFNSTNVYGHGVPPAHLEFHDQVLGRTREISFTLLLEETIAETLIMNLRTQMAHVGLRYWMIPVTATGQIS